MAEKKKVILLSNVTVDLIIAKLHRKYEFYKPSGFDTWVQETIDPMSELYHFDADAILVLLDGTEARSWKTIEEGQERLALWKQAINVLVAEKKSVPIFVSTIDIRENRIKSLSERKFRYDLENDWYQFSQNLAEKCGNVYIMDIADIIAEIGRERFYSNKIWYMSSMPYSRIGIEAVAKEMERALDSVFIPRKKIIALDLDNTLWGGVIGEDGVEGIELSDHKEGQRFYDFQRQLLEMKNRGILLAVNSKNNLEDAEAAIQNHPAMLLKDNDFVCKKINWENKAVNMKSMEEELNLTEGGFLFIDDNPAERETIKGACAEVTVPDFPIDTSELIRFAEEIWFDYFRPLKVIDTDIQKTKLYRNVAKRKQELESCLNLEEYLKKLEMVVDIHRMREPELDRVTQLINKTNQFNLTTKRYTGAEIEKIAEKQDDEIYVVCSSDKYGDNGLVSVIILKSVEGKLLIDSFVMSCRVMGRRLEDVIINELACKYDEKVLVGEFIQTEKNAPVRELYDRLGFEKVSENSNHKIYELHSYQRKKFDFCKNICFEGKYEN